MFIRLIFPSSRLPQLAASLISKQACNVAYWHETDMPKYLGDVRCWVNSGNHMLALRFSAFDPQRTLSRIYSTMFALSTIDGGMLSSSAFTVFELTVNSNSVGS